MWSFWKDTQTEYACLDEKKSYFRYRAPSNLAYILRFWKESTIVCLCIACAFLTSELAFKLPDGQYRARVQDYDLGSKDTRWRQFQWNTNVYSSADPSYEIAVSAAWDRIVPAYGIVAVEHEWAAQYNLPGSMSLPSDSSKGVYIIDAYHQLHCLTIIRKTLVELVSGQTLSKPAEHSWHCFDSLLQYVVCGTSGDTLLYTWGRNKTGEGQLRKCVDWNGRKDWAKANTACYKDGNRPVPLYDHFEHCENDDDGIQMQW